MGFWDFFRKDGILKKKIDHLEKNVIHSFENIKKDVEHVHKEMDNIKKDGFNYDKRLQAIETKIIEILGDAPEHSIVHERSEAIERIQSFNRSDQSFMNVQSVQNLEDPIKKLTPAQKQVIALLAYSGGPVDYEDVAKKLGINIVTARRHINDINRAGFKIREKVSVKNRRKMFYLDKEEKGLLEGKVRTKNQDKNPKAS